MARRFRLYHKKRGNRRTGSSKLGSIGETVFFTVFFLLGCVGLAVLTAALVIPQWKAHHEFVAHQCLVLDTRIAVKQGDDITFYHPDNPPRPWPETPADDVPLYRPEIQIEYQIAGETYRNWTFDVRGDYSADRAKVERFLSRFHADPERPYDCWYDPSDPNVAVLVRKSTWWTWLTLIVPLSFVLIGGVGLIYKLFAWGKSTERRADLAGRAGRLELFENEDGSKAEFPFVPGAGNITNSPGTNLAFRLPSAASSTWTLLVTLVVCLFWNGIVSLFAVGAVRGHLDGEPDWFLTLFIIPFLLIGIGLIVFLIRQLLLATTIGPTLVEISDQPLHPGKSYRVFLSQTGRLKLSSIELLLVCEEEATFRHGTNSRTESRRVHQRSAFVCRSFEERPGLPFETDCEIEVPAAAMHSFKSDHNEVRWKVLVRGEAVGWPDYERSFPVIVYPSATGSRQP